MINYYYLVRSIEAKGQPKNGQPKNTQPNKKTKSNFDWTLERLS